jgi:uracil-DNA glycosylase
LRPPGNKPTGGFELCRPYLEELRTPFGVKVVIVLGRLAFDISLKILLDRGQIEKRSTYAFGHAARYRLPNGLPNLLCSFHPSRQNTQTGRLTPAMFLQVFRQARRLIDGKPQK